MASTTYRKRLHDLKVAVHKAVSEYDGDVTLCDEGRNGFLESLDLPPMPRSEYVLRLRPTIEYSEQEFRGMSAGDAHWNTIDDSETELVKIEKVPSTAEVPKTTGPVTKATYEAWVQKLYKEVESYKGDIDAEPEDRREIIDDFFTGLGLPVPKPTYKVTITFAADVIPGTFDVRDALKAMEIDADSDTVDVSHVKQ